jgi:hypothetical protein
MSVWPVAGWGAKWLCPSVEAVDNVINAITLWFEELADNAHSTREVPALQHDSR